MAQKFAWFGWYRAAHFTTAQVAQKKRQAIKRLEISFTTAQVAQKVVYRGQRHGVVVN